MCVTTLEYSFLCVAQPLLRELSNEVAPLVGSKWYTLGLQLLDNQDVKVLTTIESDYRSDSETCCTKMLGRWLDTVATANWEHLITGLRSPSVKLHKLANDLAAKFGGGYSTMLHCKTHTHTQTHTHMHACTYTHTNILYIHAYTMTTYTYTVIVASYKQLSTIFVQVCYLNKSALTTVNSHHLT